MKTTLEMPDKLFRRAKATAAQRGQTLKQLVTAALEQEFAGPAPGAKTSKRKQAEVEAFLRAADAVYAALARRVWGEDTSLLSSS
jgi:hypothetical protein